MKRSVKVILAVDVKFGIAKDGKIPWHCKEDFQHFKNYTKGATCVMGRNTYEDLLTYAKDPRTPLPGRDIIVVTSRKIEGVKTIKSLDELHSTYLGEDIIICGGKRIYEESFDIFDIEQLSLTILFFDADCDTRVDIPFDKFKLIDHRTLIENFLVVVFFYEGMKE